jgi:DNA-binding MarR family transcriptional regulator
VLEVRRPPITLDEAVLLAIGEGISSISDLVGRLNVGKKDIIDAVSRLYSMGFVKVEESGFFIFRSRRLVLTERGFDEVSKIRVRLGEWFGGLGGDRDDILRELAVDYVFLLPLLYLLGFMALSDLYTGFGGEAVQDSDFSDFDVDIGVA